ncbi:Pr6Pr family membrane protein [Streptococcus dentapri]|uniref:Pr6Pr family membrane protein n=1 Tax=Streptococcus dentapri TaxID=573564 RepID=A0ABV8CYD5_9STRE
MSLTQIYRLILGICGLTGISLQLAKDGPGMLLYYTVISNIIVFASFFYYVYAEKQLGNINHNQRLLRLKGAVTMAITLTILVYHFVLAPKVSTANYWNVRNFLVHYIAPLGMIIDTLIFDRKDSYRLGDPLLWTLLPIGYCIWALLNGLFFKWPIPGTSSSPFPYFFLDLNQYDWSTVGTYILVITLFYLLLCYILFIVKKFIGRKNSL